MIIAIIPARGGSKRVPRKNITPFQGKPMIYWPIKAAIESKLFDHIIVSTDDEEISEIAISYGAEVPFIRPEKLSDDYTGIKDVIKHALDWLDNSGIRANYCCCILATAVLLVNEDLKKGLEILKKNNKKKFAFSVSEFSSPVQRSFKINKDGDLEILFPEAIKERSQDLEKIYHDAAQFYWGSIDAFNSEDSQIISDDSIPIIIPNHRSQDIDSEEDMIIAKSKFNLLKNSPVK